MKKILFAGAAGEVTGSAYVVTADDSSQVMVDFGMFQGTEKQVKQNYEPLDFNPSDVQAVFLTHAHLDHCGRLPLLVFGGFSGKVYMTEPTKMLVEIILTDAARVAERNMDYEPIYGSDQVYKLLRMIETVDYNKEIIVGSFTATFRDAGHILGSSSIELVDTSSTPAQKIVFSGDLGNTPQEIVRPTQYIDSADYIVMETTYGDKAHPAEDVSLIIQEEINAVEESGGVLLIPAFSLERTQEVLHRIHHLKKEGKVKQETPVYLDGPMGIEATILYHNFKDFQSEEMQQHIDDPFSFDGLVVTADAWDSRRITGEPNPKVIIAGSGMMSGGRIITHAKNYIRQESTRILFVGYQGEETMGRAILEGATNVLIDKTQIPVRAHIRELFTLSSHADQPKLIAWLSHIKGVKRIFLTHGDQMQREEFASLLRKKLKIKDITLPLKSNEVSLD